MSLWRSGYRSRPVCRPERPDEEEALAKGSVRVAIVGVGNCASSLIQVLLSAVTAELGALFTSARGLHVPVEEGPWPRSSAGSAG